MSPDHKSPLVRLPFDLIHTLVTYLPNCDIKSLRLTCKSLSEAACFRLKSVFLSASYRDIERFRVIADHDYYRHRIVEIIWDDTLLHEITDYPSSEEDESSDEKSPGIDAAIVSGIHSHSRYFRQSYAWTINEERCSRHIKHRDLPREASRRYHNWLLQKQEDVLASGTDTEALKYGLQRFTALRRISITPAVQRRPELPVTRGTRYYGRGCWSYTAGPSHSIFSFSDEDIPWNQEAKMRWRGVSLITRELTKVTDHRVTELVIDSYRLPIGLNGHIFDQRSEEYDNLVALFQRPGFSHIDMALWVRFDRYQGFQSLSSGYLKRALGGASDLKHLNLRFSIQLGEDERHYEPTEDDLDKLFIPLQVILPIDKWKNLRHFGLSCFFVQVDDLISVLSALPMTLRSVELSTLFFNEEYDNQGYYDLLVKIRDKLGWQNRPVNERPLVTIHTEIVCKYQCYDEAVNKFLYDRGPNPFPASESESERQRTTGYEHLYVDHDFMHTSDGAPMEIPNCKLLEETNSESKCGS